MAVSLEQLVVELVAENRDFNKKIQESKKITETSTKSINTSFSGVSESANNALTSIDSFKGLLAGAASAAIVGFTLKAIDSVDAINDLSKETGFSTKSLQELGYAASQSGADTQTLNAGLTILNRNIGDAAAGSETAEKAFARLGVSVFTSSGALKSNEQILKEVSTGMSNISSDAEKASIAVDIFGRQGVKLTQMLSEGATGLEAAGAKARELGLILSDDLIKKAAETNDKLDEMSMVLGAQVNQALVSILPMIIKSAESLSFLGSEAGKAWRAMSGTQTAEEKIASLQKQLYIMTEMKVDPSRLKAVEDQLDAVIKKEKELTDATKNSGAATDLARRNREQYRNELEKSAQKVVDDAQKGDKGEQLAKEIGLLQQAKEAKINLKGEENEVLMEKQGELATFYEEQNAKEIETLIARNEMLREIDDQKYAADIEANQKTIDSMFAANMVGSTKTDELKNKMAVLDKKRGEQEKAERLSTLTFISGLQHSKSKEMAAIGKAAAVAGATIATYDAATKAYSSLAGIPIVGPALGAAAAAAAIAAGLSNVSRIAGVDIGFAEGADKIPGVGITDSFPAMVMPGERIIKTDTNKVLERFLMNWDKSGAATPGGMGVLEIRLADEAINFIEARLIERGRLQIGLEAA